MLFHHKTISPRPTCPVCPGCRRATPPRRGWCWPAPTWRPGGRWWRHTYMVAGRTPPPPVPLPPPPWWCRGRTWWPASRPCRRWAGRRGWCCWSWSSPGDRVETNNIVYRGAGTGRIYYRWDYYIADASAYNRSFPCNAIKIAKAKRECPSWSWHSNIMISTN